MKPEQESKRSFIHQRPVGLGCKVDKVLESSCHSHRNVPSVMENPPDVTGLTDLHEELASPIYPEDGTHSIIEFNKVF